MRKKKKKNTFRPQIHNIGSYISTGMFLFCRFSSSSCNDLDNKLFLENNVKGSDNFITNDILLRQSLSYLLKARFCGKA